MAKVYGLWYGGSSYSAPEMRDLEEFVSKRAATAVFHERANTSGGYTLNTYFTDRENTPVAFPAVGEDTEMQIFTYDPRVSVDPYPSYLLKVGPKGGVRVEKC